MTSMGRSGLVVAAVRAHARLSPGLVWVWAATFAGSIGLPIAHLAVLGAVIGAVAHGGGLVVPLSALAAVSLLAAPCRVYGWAVCWAMGRRYRLAHRQRILHALLDPPGIAHMHDAATLDAVRAADNAWVVNMLEGVNNLL